MQPLTVTLIQSHLYWEDKSANLDMFTQKIANIKTPTQLVVLPEMFSTGFSMKPELFAETMEDQTVTWMKKTAQANKIILTGSVIIKEGPHYYNRLLWVLPNGSLGYYDKKHLFAFGGEDLHYSPGNQRKIAQVNGWKINLQICYDLRFPVWARQQPRADSLEYDVLLYVANWPERRSFAWTSLLVARAIENQAYVIAVNRVGEDGNGIYHSGNSMVINPLGETLFTEADKEITHTIQLQKEPLDQVREKFPFWKSGDEFLIKATES